MLLSTYRLLCGVNRLKANITAISYSVSAIPFHFQTPPLIPASRTLRDIPFLEKRANKPSDFTKNPFHSEKNQRMGFLAYEYTILELLNL